MNQKRAFKIVPLTGQDRYTRLLKDGIDTLRLKAGCVILEPGESVGEHSTEDKEEIIILLKGQAVVMIEGKWASTVEADHAIYIPPQTRHDIKNTGGATLKYVFIVSPTI